MLLALPNYLFVVTYPLLNYTSHISSTLPSGPPVWDSLPWKLVSSVLDLHSQPGEMSIIATSTTISLLKNFRLTDPTKCTPAGPTDTSKADAQTCFPASMSDPGEQHPITQSSTRNLRRHLWLLLHFYIQQATEPVNSSHPFFYAPLLFFPPTQRHSYFRHTLFLAWACKLVSLPLVSSRLPPKLSSPATPTLPPNTPVTPELLVFLHAFSSAHLHVVSISIIFMSLCPEHSTFSLLIY